MNKSLSLVSALVLAPMLSMAQWKYPETTKVNQVDNYHGTQVADPYRWLEDDRSAETAQWVKAQNTLTFDYLEKIPYRNALKNVSSKFSITKSFRLLLARVNGFISTKTMAYKINQFCIVKKG
jgi:hypothetical protein